MLGAFYGRLSAVAKQQGALMARAGPGGTASGRREGRQIRLSPGLPVGRFQKKRPAGGGAYAAGAPAAGSHIHILIQS